MDQTPKEGATFLSPEDLDEFRMRRMAVEQSVVSTAMIQSGFRLWADEIRSKYFLEGKFDIDIQSGEVALRPEKDTDG